MSSRCIAFCAVALTAVALTGLAVASGAPAAGADPAPASGLPATVTADALPTVQINGIVWSQVTVGTTVYATGSFSTARPPGAAANTQTTPVSNLIAYDITTGNMIAGFTPKLNGPGRTVVASPDRKRIYVGGDFTAVDGVTHNHIAAFTTAGNALDPTFVGGAGSTVEAIAATNDTVYAGGSFVSARGIARSNLAAYSTTGAVLSWAPRANYIVRAMVMSPDGSRVVVGGSFSALNGVAARGLGALDPATGATLPYEANKTIQDSGAGAGITNLSTDGLQIYGVGFVHGATNGVWDGNQEGPFALEPNTGKIVWSDPCHGDGYSTFVTGNTLYYTSHNWNCPDAGWFTGGWSAFHRALATTIYPTGSYEGPNNVWSHTGMATTTLLPWFPQFTPGTVSGADQAAWSVTGNSAGTYIAMGGEFPQVNGVAQQGLVRFAVHSLAPNTQGPLLGRGLATPTATPGAVAGTANLTWNSTWDRDSQLLTYRLYRDGSTTPVYSTSTPSTFWQLARMNFTDTGLSAGGHTYKLRISDPDGNATSATTSVTIGVGAPAVPPVASRDLALGRPVSQSGIWAAGFEPAKAVDGNTSGNYLDGSMSISSSDTNTWWQVDLGSSQTLATIEVYGRTECCLRQSSDYWVFASNKPFDPRLTAAEQAKQPEVFAVQQVGYPGRVKTITLPAATTARYVMVQHGAGIRDYLSLSEVKVFGPPNPNLAQGYPATQSSTFAGAAADRAVDGNLNGAWSGGSVTSTTSSNDPWWQVDLGSTKVVSTVDVFARTDCCNTLLSNYWVFLANKPFNTALTPADQAKVPGVNARHVTVAPVYSAANAFPKGSSARYVMIQLDLPTATPLQLTEVQVFS